MDDSAIEKLSASLFENSCFEVHDVKFLRGRSSSLTVAELCEAANVAFADFLVGGVPEQSILPVGRRSQRLAKEVLAAY